MVSLTFLLILLALVLPLPTSSRPGRHWTLFDGDD